jgi:hypothetical protein
MSQSRVTYFVGEGEAAPACNSTAYIFGIKDRGFSTTTQLADLDLSSEKYTELIDQNITSATIFTPYRKISMSLTYIRSLGKTYRERGFFPIIRVNDYTIYGNTYYFFTIFQLKRVSVHF